MNLKRKAIKTKANQFFNLKLLIACFLLVIIWSCDTNNDSINIENQYKYYAEKVKFSFYQANTSLLEKVDEFNTLGKFKSNTQNRTDDLEQTYTININEAIYIENVDGTHHTYTFEVIEHDSLNLKNIVLSLQPEGDYKAYLTTYQISEQELIDFNNGIIIDLTERTTLEEIDNSQVNFANRVGGSCWNLERVGQQDCSCHAVHAASGCTHPDDIYEWVEVSCPEGAGGSYGGSDTSGNPSDGNTTPIGGGVTGSTVVPTAPNIPSFENGNTAAPSFLINILGLENLSNTQINWINDVANSTKVSEALDYIYDERSSQEALLAVNIGLELYSNNILTDFDSELHLQILNGKLPPSFLGLSNSLTYYNLHVIEEMMNIMHSEYPLGHEFSYWELTKIYFKASKETLHLGLDVAGMAPGVGIVFDVTNATIYALEMDWGNSVLSLGSAIPIAGQWVTSAKLAKKVITLANGKEVYLKVYNLVNGTIKFSNRNQLRELLGIVDSTIHAHHIIPYGLANNAVNQGEKFWKLIQNAAKSNNVWHINDIYNGIPMPRNLHLSGHPAYTTAIKNKLDDIYDNLSDPNSYDEAYIALSNFVTSLKGYMSFFPNNSSGDFVNFINDYGL